MVTSIAETTPYRLWIIGQTPKQQAQDVLQLLLRTFLLLAATSGY